MPRRAVVDLGCMTRNGADSLATLQRLFAPDILYGFDPSPLFSAQWGLPCECAFRRAAAWTYDGLVGFAEKGTASRIGKGPEVYCFDFSDWLKATAELEEVVAVKMDIEGAERPVMEKMAEDGTDELVGLLLVERHAEAPLPEMRCPVVDWWL